MEKGRWSMGWVVISMFVRVRVYVCVYIPLIDIHQIGIGTLSHECNKGVSRSTSAVVFDLSFHFECFCRGFRVLGMMVRGAAPLQICFTCRCILNVYAN